MSNIWIALRSMFLFKHAKFSTITFRLQKPIFRSVDFFFFWFFLLSFRNIKGAHISSSDWSVFIYGRYSHLLTNISHNNFGKLYSAFARRLRPLIREVIFIVPYNVPVVTRGLGLYFLIRNITPLSHLLRQARATQEFF